MNRRILSLAVLLALFVTALAVTGGALAAPGQSKVSFEYVRVQTLDPGKVWTDQSGLHIRNQMDLGTISGSIEGVAVVEYNADLELYKSNGIDKPSPNSGVAFGEIQIYRTDLEKVSPEWIGSWTYQLADGVVTGGQLDAWNPFTRQYMSINRVIQKSPGAILHQGVIQSLPCVDQKCAYP